MVARNLNQAQVSGLISLGVIFWGAAVYQIRYFGHILYANDLRRLSTYLAAVPIGYSIILFSERLLGITSEQRLTTAAIISVTALLADGVAFMWFPALYENPTLKRENSHLATVVSRMGAAWLLWGVGVSLGVALLI